MAAHQVAAGKQIVTWSVDDRLFGIDIAHCREVEKNKKILRVPHARRQISGIVNLRGDIVTVVDLRVLLGNEKGGDTASKVIIRLRSRDSHVAVQADAVFDVLTITQDQMEAAPAHLSEQEVRFIQSVAMTEKGLVVILNPEEILKAI